MECTDILPTTCCNYIENMNCVASCTAPLEPDSNFVCGMYTHYKYIIIPLIIILFPFIVEPPFAAEIDGAALQSYSIGDDLVLNCSGNRDNISTVQWLRNGMVLANENSTILVIVNVTALEGGDYTCVLNSTDAVANNTVTVFISPEFTTQPASMEVSSGSIATLTCEAASFPSPTYMWGRVDEEDIRSAITTNTSMLVFNPVIFGDEGSYYCNATSGGETIQSQAITLTSEPYIIPGIKLRVTF